MAKSKYNPEIVEIILGAIALTGNDRAGFEAAGISRDTFYGWLNKYPDFSDKVKEAKSEYRQSCPETLIRQANKAFADYLFGRMQRVVYTKEVGVSLKTGEPYEKETTQHIPVGIPRWAIERVLGKPLDIIEAVKTLAEAGILPKAIVQAVTDEVGNARKGITGILTGVLPDTELKQSRPGLSEETAAAIRAHLLGIQPPDAASVPAEMGSGSEPA